MRGRRSRGTPTGIRSARYPNWAWASATRSPSLRRQVAERVAERAPELLGQGDVPEAVPGLGLGVDERRPERARRGAAARGRRATTVATSASAQAAEEPRPEHDAGLDGQDVQADRRPPGAGSASGCRPTGRRRSRRRRASDPRSPRRRLRGAAAPSGRGRRRGARRTRGGAGGDRHGSRWRQTTGVRARPRPAAMARASRAGEAPDEPNRGRRRDGDAEQREDVHPEGRLAERGQEDVGDEAEQDVRRVARRVGRAQDRQDRLELAGVPEPDTGHEPRPDDQDDDEGHEQRRQGRRAAQPDRPGPGSVRRRSTGSPSEEVAPDHAPEVDRDRDARRARPRAARRRRDAPSRARRGAARRRRSRC